MSSSDGPTHPVFPAPNLQGQEQASASIEANIDGMEEKGVVRQDTARRSTRGDISPRRSKRCQQRILRRRAVDGRSPHDNTPHALRELARCPLNSGGSGERPAQQVLKRGAVVGGELGGDGGAVGCGGPHGRDHALHGDAVGAGKALRIKALRICGRFVREAWGEEAQSQGREEHGGHSGSPKQLHAA